MGNIKKGFTIIELMIAITVLSFGIIGIYSVFSNVIVATYTISSRLTAAYLAQEGLEIVRNIRDTNIVMGKRNLAVAWSDGLLACQTGCQGDYKTENSRQNILHNLKPYNTNENLNITTDGFYGYQEGTPTIFKRQIIIVPASNNELKVTVLVIWNYNNKPFTFEIKESLYDWN